MPWLNNNNMACNDVNMNTRENNLERVEPLFQGKSMVKNHKVGE
jgi:hypothetical protein